MSKSFRLLHIMCYWLCAILLFAMTLLIFGQIIARYVFKNSLTWSEEIGRYCYVWISLIGMATAIPMGAHVSLDFLITKLPKSKQKIVALCANILMSFFSIVFTYSGIILIKSSINQISSGINISMSYIYIAFPISGLMMLFFSIKKLFADYKKEI